MFKKKVSTYLIIGTFFLLIDFLILRYIQRDNFTGVALFFRWNISTEKDSDSKYILFLRIKAASTGKKPSQRSKKFLIFLYKTESSFHIGTRRSASHSNFFQPTLCKISIVCPNHVQPVQSR